MSVSKHYNNHIFLDDLMTKFSVRFKEADDIFALERVQLLPSNPEQYQSGRVYLTNTDGISDSLLPISETSHSSFPKQSILLEVVPEENPILLPTENHWYLISNASLVQIWEALTEMMQDYDAWEMKCYEALSENLPPEEFLPLFAERLPNPIALFDTSLVVLGWAGNFRKDVKGTIWEHVLEDGFSPMEFYTRSEQIRIAGMLASDAEWISYSPASDPSHEYLGFPIRIDDHLYGMLAMIDLNETITGGQRSIALRAATFLCKYLRNSSLRFHSGQTANDFVVRILQGSAIEDRIIKHYLSERNWDMQDTWLLFNFPVAGDRSGDLFASQSLLFRVERRFPGAITVLYEHSVLMISRVTGLFSADELQENVNVFVKETGLICGHGNIFRNFRDLRYAYLQSRIALQYINEEEECISFASHYEDALLAALEQNGDLMQYCHPGVSYLAEQNGSLLHTLRTFLELGCNIQETANVLFLHRNTLVYHLEKIDRLLQLEVRKATPELRFYLLFSCLICEHRLTDSDVILP